MGYNHECPHINKDIGLAKNKIEFLLKLTTEVQIVLTK